MKTVFFGSDFYSSIVLQELIMRKYPVVMVIANKQQQSLPFYYQSVVDLCGQNNIPYIEISNSTELISTNEAIISSKATIGLIASFGYILPQAIFSLPKYGTLNIHPSLLPQYRGPTPIQQAILNNDAKTGISLMKINSGIDTGSVIVQEKYRMHPNTTAIALAKLLFQRGGQIFIEATSQYPGGNFPFLNQPNQTPVNTNRISINDAKINWDENVILIKRKIQGFFPKPVSWSTLGETIAYLNPSKPIPQKWLSKKIKIYSARIVNNILIPEIVQIEGKKDTSFKEFYQGYLR